MAQLEIGNRDELGYDGAEPGSPDEDVRFSLATYGHNLPSNVFTLSIAIRPDHQGVCTACFVHQVAFYGLVVAWYDGVYRGIKEGERITRVPLTVSVRKIVSKEVARHRGHCEMRVCLGVIKVEIFNETILCCTLVCDEAFEEEVGR